ncbi:putative transcription factor interactor and regulator CCHC(Zn) family [Rosa chinensis]|uniref:Putative transcription factor interactor and regulator CCHC(Zn) family n=1 Tax=Rosa chinensis TaxID=74649 RepID=A0A2P6Q3F4_ROSCH|nr:putative transcription factor interactor and regulator CCHC(Zn) family [Rosa chinensis]
MASSSNGGGDIPFEDEEIIEAMSINFENSVDFVDLEYGINLVGTLIADEEPGLGGTKAAIMSMWKTLGQVRIIRVKKNVYSLTVGSEKLATKLIDDSPWNVKGYCFTVRHWPPRHAIDDLEPHRATYWIQAHGIPMDQISTHNGRKLGNLLGSVIDVEDPRVYGNRGFMRIRVDFDTRRPLATFCQLPRNNSATTKIRLRYENLKCFCFKCGRLGHMVTACRYQVNPILLKLGVVYDNSLVAEPLQKPVFTQAHFPPDFPYAPTTGIFRRSRKEIPNKFKYMGVRHDVTEDTCEGEGSKSKLCSRLENDGPSSPIMSDGQLSVSTKGIQGKRTTKQWVDMWDPDTHGSLYRNGSVTVAMNGLSIRPNSWADPECIPPWAFKNKEDFLRANPMFPVPGYIEVELEPTITPPKFTSPKIVELQQSVPPLDSSTFRKRKIILETGDEEEKHSKNKKTKKMRCPGLNPSTGGNSGRGRGRGCRGRGKGGHDVADNDMKDTLLEIKNRGRKRSRGNKGGKGKGRGSVSVSAEFISGLLDESYSAPTAENTHVAVAIVEEGMEDVTHLQGCGGWPNSAARNQ